MREAELEGVLKQEQAVIFDAFDEDTAQVVLAHGREIAKTAHQGVGILVKFWDRPLAFGATKGYTHGNYLWAHRKANTVRLTLKPSYRVVLEQNPPRTLFDERWGVSAEEYAISGGAFPINVRGAGIVGAAVLSGLHERDDHDIIVEALCRTLGIDYQPLALPPRAV